MSAAEEAKRHPLLKAQAIQAMPEIARVHRLNPKAIDVSDYPRVRKRRYRENGVNEYVSWNALEKAGGLGR